MKRRDFLKSAGAVAAAAGWPRLAGAETPKRPNIILMMADDFGYECLSCNGGGPYKTPNLDAMAKGTGGMRFANCFAQPLCTPSRAKIMTGRGNFRNYTVFGVLPKAEKTFGHVAKAAGYATCIVGKWQLGRDRKLVGHFGFDEYCLWWLEQRGERYKDPTHLIRNGKVLTETAGKYGPDLVCDHMLDFITRHKDKPFFCYYPMILTHSPYVPTPDSTDWAGGRKAKGKGGGTNRHFVDMVQYTDKIVGRIVKHLEKLGLRENTVILFTGDNGTGRGVQSTLNGRPYAGGKGTLNGYSGTHVPLIASYPAGGVKGAVLDDLVDFSDFLPTVTELMGGKLPEGVTIDGVSFAPQLCGRKGTPREWFTLCYYGKARSARPGEFVRGKKFLLYSDGRMFDVVKDPLEKRPLPAAGGDPAAAAPRKELQAALEQMQAERKKADAAGLLRSAGPGKSTRRKKQ